MPTLTGKFRARFDCFAMWTAILTIFRRQTTATGMGTTVFILFVHELALSYADFPSVAPRFDSALVVCEELQRQV